MMAGVKKGGLGRGLDVLFGDIEIGTVEIEQASEHSHNKKTDIGDNSIEMVALNDIMPNSEQPRKIFDEERLNELADSIKKHGLIQPVVLRPRKNGGYEIVAGERRWRAARIAEFKKIPCIVKELTDEQNMLLAIVENMQREDLNPIEEAEGLERMISSFGLTQEQVANSIGKSRPYITNSLRLLKLPAEIRDMVSSGRLSTGHARALVAIGDSGRQLEIAKQVLEEGLSVRTVENLARGKGLGKQPRKKAAPKDVNAAQVEREMADIMGTRVNIKQNGTKGKIEIEYYSRDDLERIIDIMRTLK